MRPVSYYSFPKAPRRYFTGEDVGKEFVRTDNRYNGDLCFVVKRGSLLSSAEEQVKKYAVKLLDMNESYLAMKVPTIPPSSRRTCKMVSRGDFDDGRWMSLEDCLEAVKEDNKTFSGKGLVTQIFTHADCSVDYDYEIDHAVIGCQFQ